ncbi:surface attachment protein Sap1 [Pararobbsia silviterrae]|uniref:Uncharacterized protein n=1 Tax=Pararobbsia silviterrae TaxID=1792498 RepID=A0A494Y7D0_9BURK|nr:hypothetical protein [Pararobbsia silviterrae]RKP58619.1 hypothetical protein D7S86_01360 [Pararobbsia silviterrae]
MKLKQAFISAVVAAPALMGFGALAHADGSIAASQSFHFKANAFGCLSKDKFDAALQHEQAGEHGQAQQFFTGFDCVNTPQESEFRAIRVVGHDVEFVGASNADTEGLWTSDAFIRQ